MSRGLRGGGICPIHARARRTFVQFASFALKTGGTMGDGLTDT